MIFGINDKCKRQSPSSRKTGPIINKLYLKKKKEKRKNKIEIDLKGTYF